MDEEERTPQIDHYYRDLRFLTQQVVQGRSDLLLVNAPAGIGKSFQIERILKEDCEGNVRTMMGYVSPLELFHALWDTRHNGDILFLDDVAGLTDDERSLNVLKGATWTTDEESGRMVEWATTSDKIKCDKEFQYEGRIIMVMNDIPDNSHVDALKSRAKFLPMTFTYDERIDIIKEIAKVDDLGGTYEERLEVAEWIETYTDETFEDLNLRMLIHGIDNYLAAKDGLADVEPEYWKEVTSTQFGVDEELQLVKELLEEQPTVKAAVEEFEVQTGKAQATFYRRKKKLEEKLGKKL